jgi:hypothetical protein
VSEPAYFRSKPAQKAPPAPQKTADVLFGIGVEGEKEAFAAVSDQLAAVAGSTALRASERARMTVVTGPFFSIRTDISDSPSGTSSFETRGFAALLRMRC